MDTKYDRWRKKRDVILFLFVFIELLIIFLWPTLSCLNVCEPNYGIGFYYAVISLPYVALFLLLTYFIMWVLESKGLSRFFVIKKGKVIFFTALNLIFLALTESYLRTLIYVGRIDTLIVDGDKLYTYLYLPNWFVVLNLTLFTVMPVLLYFLSCFVFFKRKK